MPSYETERIVAVVKQITGDKEYPDTVTLTISSPTFELFPSVGQKVIIEYVWLDED